MGIATEDGNGDEHPEADTLLDTARLAQISNRAQRDLPFGHLDPLSRRFLKRPQPRHSKLLSDSVSPPKAAAQETSSLNRMQIKNEVQKIQATMDTQEISLLNHLEEVKSAEAKERWKRLKSIREETKKLL